MKLGLKFLVLFLLLFSVTLVSGVVRLDPSDSFVKLNEPNYGNVEIIGNITVNNISTDCVQFGDGTVQCSLSDINQSINVSFIWQRTGDEVSLVNPKANVTIDGDLNVTGSGFFGNNSVYVGGVKISEADDGFLNISQPVESRYFIGDGSRLTNISFNATTGEFSFGGNINMNGNNITDLGCLKFNDTTEICTAPVDTVWNIAGSKYLYNDSGVLDVDETELNNTIGSLAQISSFYYNFTVIVVNGTGLGTMPITIDYLITQVTVYPPSTPANFRFQLNETTSGDIVDRDRKSHQNYWDIYKSHSINDSVTANIYNSNVDGTFTVRIKYIDNVVSL